MWEANTQVTARRRSTTSTRVPDNEDDETMFRLQHGPRAQRDRGTLQDVMSMITGPCSSSPYHGTCTAGSRQSSSASKHEETNSMTVQPSPSCRHEQRRSGVPGRTVQPEGRTARPDHDNLHRVTSMSNRHATQTRMRQGFLQHCMPNKAGYHGQRCL